MNKLITVLLALAFSTTAFGAATATKEKASDDATQTSGSATTEALESEASAPADMSGSASGSVDAKKKSGSK